MTSEIENGHNGEIETARRKDGIRNENIDALMAAAERGDRAQVERILELIHDEDQNDFLSVKFCEFPEKARVTGK